MKGGGLENRCAARHRGAQSLPLRHAQKTDALGRTAALEAQFAELKPGGEEEKT